MNRAVLAIALMTAATAACGGGNHNTNDGGTDGSGSGSATFDKCTGDPNSFVRQAFLALDGRRPRSQAEVNAYVDLYKAAVAQGADAKDTVAQAIMSRSDFTERWVDALMDAMHVQRVDIQTEAACWQTGARATIDGTLAAAVRDQPATGAGDGNGQWTMVDLARSALALDDVTPIYRAELFSLVEHPIPAANVDPIPAELARRSDFGDTFDSAYLHRNIVCLGCHNSERSVTDSDDPAKDRFWPVPGLPEKGVYGDSSGEDIDAAHAVFRVDGFVDNGSQRPWGWTVACGTYANAKNIPSDPASITAKLASIGGSRPTVYDLEQVLARGFKSLHDNGVPTGVDVAIADPDTALAWLVTLKITEDVWHEATGTNLTIANYFPRNEASSDLLYALATKLVQSNYSIKALLSAVVASDFFDRAPPEDMCGAGPYTYPNVYDPWVISDPDPTKHLNGPGDAVQPVDPRTLVTSSNAALEWPPPPDATRFPDYGEPGCEDLSCGDLNSFCQQAGQCCETDAAACKDGGLAPSNELPFERGVGMFLRNSERGFAGIDFQARLVWENRYGACARPSWSKTDFIDTLLAAGQADPTATAADVVAELKDRLVGEPVIEDGPEHDAITAIVGDLTAPASGVTAGNLRQICAGLLESPQFLLSGIAGAGGDVPKLTPTNAGYDAVCADLAATGIGITGFSVTCAPGALTLVGPGSGSGSGSAAAAAAAVRVTHPSGVRQDIVKPVGRPSVRTPAPLATQGAMRHVPAHAN